MGRLRLPETSRIATAGPSCSAEWLLSGRAQPSCCSAEGGPRRRWDAEALRVRENRGVQFSPELRGRVADGSITVSFRLWSRPKVRVGGTYRSGAVTIEVDDVDLLPFAAITDEDLARTGEPDREALRRRAAHAGPIHEDTLLYRVEFHVVSSRE